MAELGQQSRKRSAGDLPWLSAAQQSKCRRLAEGHSQPGANASPTSSVDKGRSTLQSPGEGLIPAEQLPAAGDEQDLASLFASATADCLARLDSSKLADLEVVTGSQVRS